MSKITISNTGVGAIGLPIGGLLVAGNGSIEGEAGDFAGLTDHPVIAAHIKSGRLKIEGGIPSASGASSASAAAAKTGYAVKDKGAGWFVVTKDGAEVTKGLRKDAVNGFDAKSDEDKAAFVAENKAD